ncbi:MAG: TolC family protein [Bacteriovoracaceae bacterium]|jgi:outer membrane protein TolC|nr:hypothetical protein [Halobacteriovoraceae bacterium]MDP7319982.1 TolC family protein [Bacteriovoracaceae bacterium]
MKKISVSFFVLVTLLGQSLTTNAQTQSPFNIRQEVQEIFNQSEGDLSLEELQELAIGEGTDIKVAYQRLYQAQKDVAVARAQYFPYGTGLLFNYNAYAVWNTLIIVELITSLPTKFYNVRKNKNLRTAQAYGLTALKENIKNEVAKFYYNLLKQQSMLKLAKIEYKLLQKLYGVQKEHVLIGLINDSELLKTKQRLNSLKDDIFKFESYLVREKEALYTLISQGSLHFDHFSLKPIRQKLTHDSVELSLDMMLESAIENSPELDAADFMISAAFNEKRSTQWSLLSFSGIGFGYWARVNVSQSKLNEMYFARERAEDTIVNQVYTRVSEFENSINYLKTEDDILSETTHFMQTNFELFESELISLDKLLEAQILYVKDYRESVMAHYDSYISYSNLERAVMGQLNNISQPKNYVDSLAIASEDDALDGETGELLASQRKDRKLRVWVDTKRAESIDKVVYQFDTETLKDMTSTYKQGRFEILIKLLKGTKSLSGQYQIYYTNGKTEIRNFKIN